MNKKFYLGAILLGAMTLSTGALTSCIDNDEPEGITNLRGAKAELLRAKAAVELAKAETEKQNANWVAALAAIDQAKAKQEEAKAKQEEAKVAYEQARAAYEQAMAEQQKAEALKRMAEAQEEQAKAEANIAWIKAQNELELQKIKNDLLKAQNTYDQLVAEIEAAKAVLTGAQAKKLADLQWTVDQAWYAYTYQQGQVLTAMDELFKATNGEVDWEETLRDELAKAEAKLEAVNAAYGELKALSENVAPTAWESRMDELKAYGDKTNGTYKLEIAELELKKNEIKQSEAYKTAFVEDTTARRAYITAQQLYNYLADGKEKDCFTAGEDHEGVSDEGNMWGYYSDGTHPTSKAYTEAKKYDLQGAKIVITNPEVYNKLIGTPGLVSDGQGMRLEVDGTFVADGHGLKYSDFTNLFSTVPGATQPTITKTVAGWETALAKVNVTDEEIAAGNCVANYEKAVADAEKKHKEAVAKWEKAHKTYADQKVAETVSTATIKAAIGLYNANIDALVAAVDEYNTKYDAAVTRLYNVELEKAKIYVAKNAINTELAKTPAVTVGTVTTQTTLAQIDALIDADPVLTDAQKATKKADYKKVITAAWEGQTITAVKDAETKAMTQAENDAKNVKDVTDAKAAYNKVVDKFAGAGWDATKKVYTGSYATIATAVTDFIAAARENSEKLTADADKAKDKDYTGVATEADKKYINGGTKTAPSYGAVKTTDWVKDKLELDDSDKYVKKGHKVVVRTKVSDDAIKAMTAVEFNPAVAKENWHEASKNAFGTDNSNSRHTELTADMIKEISGNYYDENGKQLPNYAKNLPWEGSSLYKLDEAKKTLAAHQNHQGVNAEIASLKEKVAEAKAAMLAQIAEYTAAVNEAEAAIEPAKKEHQAKHKAAEALLQPVKDEIKKIEAIAKEYRALAGKLQAILNAYYDINDFSYVDEEGKTQSVDWGTTTDKDFSKVAEWLKSEIAKYEKNDTSDGAPADSEGKIKDAEAAVAKAQKDLDRWIADGEFDAVAKAQLALDNAQALLETLKARYDFALSQLNDYVAALSK